MISGESLYRIYTDIPESSGSSRKRKTNKKRFIKFAEKAQSNFLYAEHTTRDSAKSEMVSKFGFIEFWIFKTIIMWIIEQILNYYFGPVNSDQNHQAIDGRIV